MVVLATCMSTHHMLAVSSLNTGVTVVVSCHVGAEN